MRSRFQKLIVASVMVGLVASGSAVHAIAEEAPEENAVAAEPTVAPTMTPATVPGPATAPNVNWQEKKHDKHKVKKRELELNWNVAIGTATYEENSQENSLSSMGAMVEINPGNFVTTAPGLDIGMVVGFLFLTSDGSFSVADSGPPATQRNWEIAAMSVGSYILAKYSYEIDLDVMTIGLENGLGVGYFISNVDAEWKDASDSTITGDTSEDNHNWAPVLKAGLKIAFPVTDVSSLGLNLGANLIPLIAGDYNNFITISAGLNYQVRY